jgi:hypothetical protein
MRHTPVGRVLRLSHPVKIGPTEINRGVLKQSYLIFWLL